KTKAFTLIELLTVIAIIGILAGILIPTVSAVRTSANKARTKAQFSQWATALGLFKQEYGYYPTTIQTGNKIESDVFIAALSGRDYKGSPAESDAKAAGNKKLVPFYSFSDSDLKKDEGGEIQEQIVDAFGNEEIAIIMDRDGNGVIDGSDGSFVPVKGIDDTVSAAPDLPASGIRDGVVYYSAGKGGS